MNAQEKTTTEKNIEEIQLVKGTFSHLEASHIILNLIDEKINFHKIQRLQFWEGNHNSKTDQLDKRIEELRKDKQVARSFINKAKGLGKSLKINGILEISMVE